MGQAGRDGYSAAELAQMRRSEMEKARMYAYECRGGPGGQYSAMHMHHMPGPYHSAGASGAYMRQMAADRDYSGEMDEVVFSVYFRLAGSKNPCGAGARSPRVTWA